MRTPLICLNYLSDLCYNRAQIEGAFTDVFDDIDKLIDAQIHKAKDQGLSVTVRLNYLENLDMG